MIVLDCSYTMALVMHNEALPGSLERILAARLYAPALWPFEVANALRNVVRRGRLSDAAVSELCSRIEAYDVQLLAANETNLRGKYVVSQTHDLTAYDAAYLDMAVQHRYALATLDTRLAAVAQHIGVEVIC